MTTGLVSQALAIAVGAKRPRPGLIHHSDRGSQYCAQEHQDRLRQFGMTASMSRRGNCYDNAPMESVWGTLKNELVHQRRHSRLRNRSSAAFAQQWARQQPAA